MKITKATILTPLHSLLEKKVLPTTDIILKKRVNFLKVNESYPRVIDMEINEDKELVLTFEDVAKPITLVNTAFYY